MTQFTSIESFAYAAITLFEVLLVGVTGTGGLVLFVGLV
jgi:nitrate reductase NapE component